MEEEIEVEILKQATTSSMGVLSVGDKVRCSAAFAKHLVKEALCAKYVNGEPQEPVVETPKPKPSDGLKVEELKAALTERGIEIPDGALKADLAALLDATE